MFGQHIVKALAFLRVLEGIFTSGGDGILIQGITIKDSSMKIRNAQQIAAEARANNQQHSQGRHAVLKVQIALMMFVLVKTAVSITRSSTAHVADHVVRNAR